jgi:hypothetical protein
MMARREMHNPARPVSLWAAMLRVLASVLLLLVGMIGVTRMTVMAKAMSAAPPLPAPDIWTIGGRILFFLLLCVGPVAAVLWLRPWRAIVALADEPPVEDGPPNLKPQMMSALLGIVALAGISAACGVVGAVLFDPRIKHPVNMLTWVFFALFLLIGLFALWGLVRLKPWARREPISPSTRRTNALFGLSGVVATASVVALMLGIGEWDRGFGLFSNSPVGLWLALFAILTWVISWAIAWLWYFSADEHEQRASDVGLLIGGLLFAVATPVWWVAARAGLVAQPNAMVLWLAVNLIWTFGWFWRRSR